MSHGTSQSVSRDGDLVALRRYLDADGVATSGELAGGRANLTDVVADQNFRWVLPMPPPAGLTPSAHDAASAYRVITAIDAGLRAIAGRS